MVYVPFSRTFPEHYSSMTVVDAADGVPLGDAEVSAELLSAKKYFEMWDPTLLANGERIAIPPRPVDDPPPIISAEVGVSVSISTNTAPDRPFPPGDPKAKHAESMEVTPRGDGAFDLKPKKKIVWRQHLYPFRTPLGPNAYHTYILVITVTAPGYKTLEFWIPDTRQPRKPGSTLSGHDLGDWIPPGVPYCEFIEGGEFRFHMVPMDEDRP